MNSSRTLARHSLPYLAALGMACALSGCSAGTDADKQGTQDTPLPLISDPGAFQTLKVVSVVSGIFVLPTPASAPCRFDDPQVISVTAASSMLSWDFCGFEIAGNNATPVVRRQGSRALSPEELASVAAALGRITEGNPNKCGADAPVVTLDVEMPTAQGKYADDYYAGCPFELHSGRSFVSGIGELQAVLHEFVTKTE